MTGPDLVQLRVRKLVLEHVADAYRDIDRPPPPGIRTDLFCPECGRPQCPTHRKPA